jgi:hypothetical protein
MIFVIVCLLGLLVGAGFIIAGMMQKNKDLARSYKDSLDENKRLAQGLTAKQAQVAKAERELRQYKRVKAKKCDPEVASYDIQYECRDCQAVNLVNISEDDMLYAMERVL